LPLLVSNDIDGTLRGTATTLYPDAGAHERTDACAAGLSGTYPIGPTSLFPTFTSAVNTMVSCGISGPVVFQVASGTYNEQVVIPPIPGTSATNTITFESLALDSTAVILSHPSQVGNVNDYTVRLNGVDHLTLRKMTIQRSGALSFGRVIDIAGTSTDIQLRNNLLLPSSSVGGPAYNHAITFGVSTDIGNSVVSQCRVENGSGLIAATITGGSLLVQDNVFANVLVGMTLSATSIAINIDRNTVNTRTGAGGTRGMLLTNISGALAVTRNTFTGNSTTYYGIVMSSVSGTALLPIRFENNMIIGINSVLSAVDVLAGACNYLDIFHNSICMTGASASGLVMVLGTGTGCRISNNAIRSMGSALRINPASRVSSSDNNVLFSSNGSGVTWGIPSYATIAALTAASGMNANSLMMDPGFVDPVLDLHLQSGSPCAGRGQTIASITLDQEGEVRPQPAATAPDVGADETPEYCDQLNGTYTIGTSVGSDHNSFAAAILKMTLCGINGPVTFLVENGTYTEQLVLPNIPGNSTTNTITFRGQSLDSSLVILTWPTGSGAPTVRMSGADRVTFEHMTIQRTGTATLPGAVVDWESTIADATTRSQYITFSHCRLISSATSNALSALVLGLAQNDENDVRILNCVMQGGHTGVRWNMNSLVSLTVRACVFSGQYNRAIACITPGASDPELLIENNIIQAPTFAGTTAVQVEHNSNLLRVTGNRITVPTSNGIGIDITCAGIDPYWTQVANNMVQCTGTARGIRMVGNNTGLGLYHNSVSTQFGYPLELPGTGSGNHMVGNAFRSSNTYNIYRAGSLTFAQADRNALFSPSANFVWWSAAVSDIAALRCLTGQQLNSIQADPLFVNNTTDLHLQSGSPCAGQSIFLSGVDYDFDGELLSLPVSTFPDIGADEINEDCTLIGGTYVIGPSAGADFATFTAAVTKLLTCGINGPVLFLVENGTYTEQIRLSAIKGSTSTNTVTFRGQALNSSTVILQTPSSTSATNNHLVANTGADHVRFEHMTLRRTGTQSNARVVHLNPLCDRITDMRLSNCVITNSSIAFLTADLVGRQADPMQASFRMEDCTLQGGGYAFQAQPASPQDTISIIGCTRTGGAGGIVVLFVSGPITIQDNDLTGTATDAIQVSQCTGPIDISRNRITGGSGTLASGIFVSSCLSVAPARVVVTNNEVIFSGGIGIRINGPSERVDVVYNSVQMLVPGRTAMAAVNGVSATDTRIRNNVFSSISVHAASVSLTGITAERNLFWRTGLVGPTVYWNSVPYTTAAALTAGSGTNSGTLYRDPLFFDLSNDLRSYAMQMDQAAGPFAGITTDKDGQPRHATTPDIGAFEFQPTLWSETFNTCSAADPIVSTGSGQDQWIYKDRKVVARFNDNGQNLGTVTLSVYVNNGPIRQSLIGQHYMDRNWQLTTQNPITTGAIVRLFHSAGEFNTYAAADPVVNVYADAGVAHYAGANENCQLMDNPAGNAWVPLFPASPSLETRIQSAGGTNGYTAVVAFDGEFYITSMGSPLPVELLSFTAQRTDQSTVSLAWTTATERDNAGFEVWRMIEGEDIFKQVGWVDGIGNSQQLTHYAFNDDNGSDRTSYYRIAQVDHDGTSKTSQVVPVQGVAKQANWSLFPNPARERFSVQGLTDVVEVRLLDGAGRQVQRWSGEEVLHLPDLASGLYLVQVQLASGKVEQRRLVLQ